MKLIIPLHSFSGLITNSSSETFTCVSENAVDAVRKIVNSILKASGSNKVCSDLLDIKYVYRITEHDYTNKKFKEIVHEFDSEEEFDAWYEKMQEEKEGFDCDYNEDMGITMYGALSVTAKDSACKDAARILSSIESLVNCESYHS